MNIGEIHKLAREHRDYFEENLEGIQNPSVTGFIRGFEAGAEAKQKEILDMMKMQIKNHPDPYYSSFLGDWIEKLENLSK